MNDTFEAEDLNPVEQKTFNRIAFEIKYVRHHADKMGYSEERLNGFIEGLEQALRLIGLDN